MAQALAGLVVGAILIAIAASSCVFHSEISAIAVEMFPDSNYELSKDHRDMRQLSDGHTAQFPIWSDKQSVTWEDKNIAAIRFKLTNVTGKGDIRINLHSALAEYADMRLPRRVDVYLSEDNISYFWAGVIEVDKNRHFDRTSVWLSGELHGTGHYAIVVVHADGRFISVDEITYTESSAIMPRVSAGTQATNCSNIQSCLEDSRYRLKSALRRGIAPVSGVSQTPQNYHKNLYIAEKEPWGDLSKNLEVRGLADLYGLANERETKCYELRHLGGGSANYSFRVVGESGDHAVRLSYLKPVIAADGQQVYDIIAPLPGVVKLDDHPYYVWIDVDFTTLHDGDSISINILDAENRVVSQLKYQANIYQPRTIKPPINAVNWAYANDPVVWRDDQTVLNDLVAHGVNVHVIPWQLIPGLALDGRIDEEQAARFNELLELYSDQGKVLLYMGWSGPRRPNLVGKNRDKNTVERFHDWLRWVDLTLKNAGYAHDQWALYPIDEVRDDLFPVLLELAQIVKVHDKEIEIYANPTSGKASTPSVHYLDKLGDLIDIWQPQFNYAVGEGRSFFSEESGRKFWIYKNPPSPPKSSSPWYDYRLMMWQSYGVGAHGVGFWAYNDVSGRSNWDDFDGTRPDWSVVYERKDGSAYSSRRWEAFREGVEDFRLLQYAGVAKTQLPDLAGSRQEEVLQFRERLLKSLILDAGQH